MFLGVFRFTENMKFVLRPTLMGTKNLIRKWTKFVFFGVFQSYGNENVVVVVVVVVAVVSHIQRIGCQPEKTTLHGGQSRSWSAEQGKESKRKSLAAYPLPPPHCSFGENK